MTIKEDKLPKLGLVITQKNEAAILNHNIEYHRFMGVSHFYIFDDGSTDGSMDTIPDREGVYKFYGTDYSNVPKELESVKRKALEGNWIGRQVLNSDNALQLAKEHGVDWLLFIDADELVYFRNEKENSFREVFNEIESDNDIVLFSEVFEVVQDIGDEDNIFKSSSYFKTPEYDKIQEREFLDPMKSKMITLKGFMGHNSGKQAARVNSDLIPVSSHSFKNKNREIPKTLYMGQIYHFHGCSFSEFMKQNSLPHPSHFIYGSEVPYYPKLFWRDLVQNSGLSELDLRAYYEKWIMFSEEEVTQLLDDSNGSNPIVIEFKGISNIWDAIKNQKLINKSTKT